MTITLPNNSLILSNVQRNKILKELGLKEEIDLLHYYPNKYINYRRIRINKVNPNDYVTIVGVITKHTITTANNNPILTIEKWWLKDKTGNICCTKFYQHHYYQSQKWRIHQNNCYQVGTIVYVTGKTKYNDFTQKVEIINPNITVIDRATAQQTITSIVPIYRLIKGISNDLLTTTITDLLTETNVIDPLPLKIQQKFNLQSLKKALFNIHFPKSTEELELARYRLIFDEFFYLSILMLQRRNQWKSASSPKLTTKSPVIKQFLKSLPFKLTEAQKRVAREIFADLRQPNPMNRLIQGDVGSGKTIISVLAAISAIESGYQVALMAPTQVLAEQHYRTIANWLQPLDIETTLLTGSTTAKQRRQICENLANGKLPLIIGTHAIFSDGIEFQNLGLVIIDEQHRFGVSARTALQNKGQSPHILTMTATPIPRTLALTVHGDLDVSQIDELPPGRRPVLTKLLTSRTRHKAYEMIKKEVESGRQAFIIFPLIQESDKLDLKAAISEHERLQQEIFPDINIGLLHGQMKPLQKQEAIAKFNSNETPILVSTTVVEVGIDCPNATVQVIEHAERFGLAQLHQLRGRVGRNQQQSYCFLISDSNSKARQRLRVMETISDGFMLAEIDLQLRGAGELLGTLQHGVSAFSLCYTTSDDKAYLTNQKEQEILNLANKAAQIIINKDPQLERFPLIQSELNRRYPKRNNVVLN